MKYTGLINWAIEELIELDASSTRINQARWVPEENRLSFDFDYDECNYTVVLRGRLGGVFQGIFQRWCGGRLNEYKVSCDSEFDRAGVLLFGRWLEDGDEYYWRAELERVEDE